MFPVAQLGREEPSVSMDIAGKIVYARNAEILTATLQSAGESYSPIVVKSFLAHIRTIFLFLAEDSVPDGQKLSVISRELGNTEVYAQTLQHSPNGRYVFLIHSGQYFVNLTSLLFFA